LAVAGQEFRRQPILKNRGKQESESRHAAWGKSGVGGWGGE